MYQAASVTDRTLAEIAELDRAIKLWHLPPALLLSTDGKISRQQREALFRQGDLASLVASLAKFSAKRRGGRGAHEAVADSVYKKVAQTVKQRRGISKAAKQLLEGLKRPHTPDVFAVMVEKHPSDDVVGIAAAIEEGRIVLGAAGAPEVDYSFCTPAALVRVLKEADPTSAPGLNGLRYMHLQVAVKATGDEDGGLAVAMARLWRMLLQHPQRFPPPFWALYSAGRLSAMGETKLRPITVTSAFTRLIDAATVKALLPSVQDRLSAVGQLGVGTSLGVEQMALAVRLAYEGGQFIYTNDSRSAFQEISRVRLMKAAVALPAAFEYLITQFGAAQPDLLFHMDDGTAAHIASRRGVPQGSPWGPLWFALGTLPVLESFQAYGPPAGVQLVAFLDDHQFMGGSPSDVEPLLRRFTQELYEVAGLTSQPAKSFATHKSLAEQPLSLEDKEALDRAGFTLNEGGVVTVGVPIGSSNFRREHAVALIDKSGFLDVAEHLGKMSRKYTQAATQIAVHSLPARLNHIMRSVEPDLLLEMATKQDVLAPWVIEQLMNLPESVSFADITGLYDRNSLVLTPLQQLQAQLPIRSGGLQLANVESRAPAVFVAAQLQVLPLVLAPGHFDLDGELLPTLHDSPYVSALHGALKSLVVDLADSDSLASILPGSWLEWSRQPLGTVPSLLTLQAQDLPAGTPQPKPNFQKRIMKLVHEKRRLELEAAVTLLPALPADPSTESCHQASARLKSISGPGAGAWLYANGSEERTQLGPEHMELALRRRLGYEESYGQVCPARGCTEQRANSRHGCACTKTGVVARSHTALKKTLSSILTAAKIHHVEEDTAPFTAHGNHREIGSGRQLAMDITIPAGALANSSDSSLATHGVLLDVTVPNIHSAVHLYHATRSSANFEGAAADHAATTKRTHYLGKFSSNLFKLWPMPIESGGRLGEVTAKFLSALAEHVVGGRNSVRRHQKGPLLAYYRKVISVSLQRCLSSATIAYRRLILLQDPTSRFSPLFSQDVLFG